MFKTPQEFATQRAIRKLTLNECGYNAGPIRYPIMPDTGKGYLHSLAYASGLLPPNYPVPATELDGALAATPERVSFLVKAMLLQRT